MEFVADFHIHSKYSRATSRDMDIPNLAKWAKLKGINLLGTGDFTHHLWLQELKQYLEPKPDSGLYAYQDINFILSAEISSIYSQKGKVYRVHNVIMAPSFEVVTEINKMLSYQGNLASDGRPILGMSCLRLAEELSKISKDIMLVPAHIWTPWFSVFGSNSGFNSLEKAFGKYTQNITALETGLSCYDEKTEVLTEDGWKQFSQTNYSDKICTLNIKTNKIEFQKPTKIFTYKYKGKMYKLKTKRVDLLVTPNHKLLYGPCDFRKAKPYLLKEAEFLFGKSKRLKKDGVWIGKNPEHFMLPAVKIKHGSRYYSGFRNKKKKLIPIRPWLKFFGFWIAEGWTTKGSNGDYSVCVCGKDKKLLNEMKKILNSFGYRTYQDEKIIRVRNYQLFHYLKQFGKCYDKFIPVNIKSLSKELLEIFLEYYIKGDGHVYGRNKKGLSATTTSIRLRDDLQEIALKIGISAYYKLEYKKGKVFISPGCKKIYKQRNDSWVIFFIRHNKPIILPSTIKKYKYTESWVNYNGLVFCLNVPNQVIYIRRNGIPLWCGNSDPAMNWRLSALDKFSLISNSDSHSPSRIGREANVFNCELNYFEIKKVLERKDKNKFLYTIEFFPEEGKYHYDGHRNCKVIFHPQETKKHKGLCPKCGRPLTKGVLYRVEELADRPYGFVPENAIGYKSLVPLEEIIAEARGIGKQSKAVQKEYLDTVSACGSEFDILVKASQSELFSRLPQRVAEGIKRVRAKNLKITPGHDGEYGVIKIFGEEKEQKKPDQQLTLF